MIQTGEVQGKLAQFILSEIEFVPKSNCRGE
jgi:hypothetical protein